jgi:hypothetical protein
MNNVDRQKIHKSKEKPVKVGISIIHFPENVLVKIISFKLPVINDVNPSAFFLRFNLPVASLKNESRFFLL